MYIRDGFSYNLIENNYIEAINNQRAALASSGGNQFQDPTKNIFRNNTFIGINSDAINLYHGGNSNIFENNLIWSDGNGVFLTNMLQGTFNHNTIYNQRSTQAVFYLGIDNSSYSSFNNNIFYSNLSTPEYFITCATGSIPTYSGNNNVFYGTSPVSLCGYSLSGWRTATGDDANSIQADPLFVNAPAGNFHLQSSSPACNINGSYAGAYPCTAPVGNSISTCQTISSPGVYTLSNNINSPSNNCIIIRASNVILDGQNYTINYGSVDGGTSVFIDTENVPGNQNLTNITIRNIISNGKMRNHEYDPYAANNPWYNTHPPRPNYSLTKNVTIEYSNFSAINIYGSDDVLIRYNKIHNPTRINNGTLTVGTTANSYNSDQVYDRCLDKSSLRAKVIGNVLTGSSGVGAKWMEFSGTVSFCTPNGYNNYYYTNNLIENNTIINDFDAALGEFTDEPSSFRVIGIKNATVRGNIIISTGTATGMYFRDGANHLVENNYVLSNKSHAGVFSAFFMQPGNEDIFLSNLTVRNNTFIGNEVMGFWNYGQGNNNMFANNLMIGKDNRGQGAHSTVLGETGTNNIYYHNTFYTPSTTDIIFVLSNGNAAQTWTNNISNNIFYHYNSNPSQNIIYNCANYPYINYQGDNNIFYGNGPGLYCGNNLASWRSLTGGDANSRETNPLFVNSTIGDFRLQAGSPGCLANNGYIGAYPCSGIPVYTCTDSDSAVYPTINNLTNGTANNETNLYTDYCTGSTLTEYYCQSSSNLSILSTPINCQYGCSSGACLASAPDTTSPILSGLISYTTSNSVIINWTTNEIANSIVKFGTVSGIYSNSVSNISYLLSHSIEILGLTPGNLYYYVINSSDPSGNSVQSFQQTFTAIFNPLNSIIFISPTPVNNAVLSNPNVTINMSVNAPEGIDKLILKMNNINYSLPDGLSCNLENNLICDNGINGIGSGLTYTSGRFGQSVVVDATDNLYFVNNNIYDTNEGTVMFWVSPQIAWALGTNYVLFDNYNTSASNGIMILKSANYNIIRYLVNTDIGGRIIDYPSTLFSQNSWNHVAITYGAGNISLYINGIIVGSNTTGNFALFNPNIYLGVRRDNLYQANAAFDEFNIFKTKLSPQEINNIYNKEIDTYSINLLDLANGIYSYNASLYDYLGLKTDSLTRTFTISNLPPDTQSPQYSNIINPSSNTYVRNGAYHFNITWTDNVAIDKVWIEHNLSGTLRNTTVSLSGSQYSFLVNDLAAGSYSYRWYANDTRNNVNYTNIQLFTINKAIPICSIIFNPVSPITYPTQLNATGSCSLSETQVNMYRNNILVNSENGRYTTLGVNSYNYLANVTSTQNYTSATMTPSTMLVQQSNNPVYLTLNGGPQNITILDSQNITAIGSSISSNFIMYRNGVDVTSQSGSSISLPVGIYNYKVNSTGNQNYTINSTGISFTVNVSTTVVPDTQPPQYSDIINPSTITYVRNGEYYFNITWTDSSGISRVWIEHNFQGIKRNVSINTMGNGQYSYVIKDLAAGSYSYRWYANDTNGNIANTNNQLFIISKAVPYCNLTKNGNLIKNSKFVWWPAQYNITGYCTISSDPLVYNLSENFFKVYEKDFSNSEGSYNIFNENGMNISRASMNSGGRIYDYKVNITDTSNYTYSEKISNPSFGGDFNVWVLAAQSLLNLKLNGIEGNISILNTQVLNVTGNSTSPNFKITRNETQDVTSQSGLNVSLLEGYYEYWITSKGDENHSADNDGIIYSASVISPTCLINCPFTINLKSGINLVSIPLVFEDNSIATIFGPILSNINRIYSYNPQTYWNVYNTNINMPKNFDTIDPYKAYFIVANNDTSINVIGNVSYANGTSPQWVYDTGWNLVGIHSLSQMSARDAFGYGIVTNISEVWALNSTNNYVFIQNSSTILEPGKGYWVLTR